MNANDEKICIYCSNRMECERYMEWLKDPKDLIIPRANNCEKYKEREDTND